MRVDELPFGELASGSAGLLVAEAHFALASATKSDVRRLHELIDHAFVWAISSQDELGLFGGLAGVEGMVAEDRRRRRGGDR